MVVGFVIVFIEGCLEGIVKSQLQGALNHAGPFDGGQSGWPHQGALEEFEVLHEPFFAGQVDVGYEAMEVIVFFVYHCCWS